jgi:hypothetical protein
MHSSICKSNRYAGKKSRSPLPGTHKFAGGWASQLVADAAGNVSIEGPAAERGTTCTIGALCDAQPPANLCVPGKGERDFLPA